MVYKGICSRLKAIRPKTGQRYLISEKRCQVSQLFINWKGTFVQVVDVD